MSHETLRFWAAWSAVLLGDSKGLDVLQRIVEYTDEPALQQRAVDLLARAMDLEPARLWIRQLLLDERLTLLVIHGLGILGDSSAIPWLIRCMSGAAAQACQAGAAFSLITGVDLVKEGLEAGSLEAAGDAKSADPSSLPCPDSKAVIHWWSQQRSRYKKGRSYLMGFPINLEMCWQVLVHGRQFQRAAAAVELARLEPQTALFPIEAPGFRQWEWLSAIRTVVPAGDDLRSTIPLQFVPKARSTPSLEPAAEILTIQRAMPLSESPHGTDQSMVSTMEGLAKLTRPITKGWLFRSRLVQDTEGKATPRMAIALLTTLDSHESGISILEHKPTILLPEPTSAAVLTARNRHVPK